MATSPTTWWTSGAAGAAVSDDMVQKVGVAVGKVALIQQSYAERLDAEPAAAARQALAEQAQQEAVAAIDAVGVSLDDYHAVVTAADGDPALEERLLASARAAL